MTEEKLNRTDQAWEQLINRIRNDGLLEGIDETDKQKSFFNPWLKRAAAVTIICIAGIIALLYLSKSRSNSELLTLLNYTDKNTTLVKTLEDGSIVYLSKGASLKYPQHFEKHKREIYLQGTAIFDVHGNKERPFYIETGSIRIEVTGTKFSVKTDNKNNYIIAVNQGNVKVSLKNNNQSIMVIKGQRGFIDNGILKTEIDSDTDEIPEINHLQFKDESLGNIVDVLNRNNPNGILEISPSLVGRQLTVTFSDSSLDTAAQLICIALDLKYNRTDNIIRICEK